MPSALVPLANLTLAGSTATTVTFSSISQSYRDLMLVLSATAPNGQNVWLNFNSDSGANYAFVAMYGDGTTATSGANAGTNTRVQVSVYGGFSAGASVQTIHIMDYSATDKHKTVLARASNAGQAVEATANRWANTSAITSVVVSMSNAQTFNAGSTFALYGIASA